MDKSSEQHFNLIFLRVMYRVSLLGPARSAGPVLQPALWHQC